MIYTLREAPMSIHSRILLIVPAAFLIVFALFLSQYALSSNPHSKTNRDLQRCLGLADYVGRSKVYSCQKTAQIGAFVSFSFAGSFSNCIDQMDRVIGINRDACHKKYSNR